MAIKITDCTFTNCDTTVSKPDDVPVEMTGNTITVDQDTLRAMLEQAYALGFAVSGEGWNAEYPFADKCNDYEDDEDWCDSRDRNIAALLAEIMRTGEQT